MYKQDNEVLVVVGLVLLDMEHMLEEEVVEVVQTLQEIFVK